VVESDRGYQNVYANFFTPLSDITSDQWTILSNMIESLINPLVHDADCWSYIWGHLFSHQSSLTLNYKVLWMLIQFSNGCGSPVVEVDTSSLAGCYFVIG
jgi:hypothetical protein